MNKSITTCLIIFIILLISNSIFSQWSQVHYSSPGTGAIYGISFANQNTGWICGKPGMIKKSNDGGASWLNQSIGLNIELNNFNFSDANTGFVSGENCSVYKTTNGGINWILKYSDSTISNPYFIENFFINSNSGYFVGGKIIKTTDGGNTFTVQNHPFSSSVDFRSVCFIDAQTGWSGTRYNSQGNIIKTTNGGLNWNIQSIIGYSIKYIKFFSSTNGIIISTTGSSSDSTAIWKSTNGGSNWTLLYNFGIDIKESFFINETTGWLTASTSGQSRIYKTTNGGSNWNYQTYGAFSFWSINFIDNNYGWVGGGNSTFTTIFKTTNGGPVFVNEGGTTIPEISKLFQNFPNPFNPITKIEYELPKYGFVSLIIYDILGREVKTLVNEIKQKGRYTVEFNGSQYASGIYFCKLQVDGGKTFTAIKKMVMIK